MRIRIANVGALLFALVLSVTPGYLGNAALAANPVDVTVVDSPDPVTSGQILQYTWTTTK